MENSIFAPPGADSPRLRALTHLAAAALPVRRVVRKSPKRMVGKFASRKMGRSVHWESQIERDAIYHFEADNDIAGFWPQPHRLRHVYRGEPHSYVPDFLVASASGKPARVIEVKTHEEANTPENKDLFDHLTEIYSRCGLRFIVLTDRQIRVEPRLRNVRLLCRYRYPPPSPEFSFRLTEALDTGRPRTLGELARLLDIGADWPARLLGAAVNGLFSVDVSRAFSLETKILSDGGWL